MKNSFIELTEATNNKDKILINLLNVNKIVRYKGEQWTIISFNSTRDSAVFYITVNETYEEIKALIQAQS